MFFLYVLFFFVLCYSIAEKEHQHNLLRLKTREKVPFQNFFHIQPSVQQWQPLDTPRQFTIMSMKVDHHSDSPWYIPALHAKHSIGWNRTQELPAGNRPYACSIRFVGVGLESTLEGYQTGGTGYITIGFKTDKMNWHGFERNETHRAHCYYRTNKDTGSEFIVRAIYLSSFTVLLVILLRRIHPRHLD